MSFQKPILVENDIDNFPMMFGVTKERHTELFSHVEADLRAELAAGTLTKSRVLEIFIKKAENVEELAFLAFQAGGFSTQLDR